MLKSVWQCTHFFLFFNKNLCTNIHFLQNVKKVYKNQERKVPKYVKARRKTTGDAHTIPNSLTNNSRLKIKEMDPKKWPKKKKPLIFDQVSTGTNVICFSSSFLLLPLSLTWKWKENIYSPSGAICFDMNKTIADDLSCYPFFFLFPNPLTLHFVVYQNKRTYS